MNIYQRFFVFVRTLFKQLYKHSINEFGILEEN